ncbi:hypothetical protein M3Y98_00191900 [Aphelenchoides besseyi]|nr:hypothetical protein M3Y98_00191900 [Aphelenchoides besseyi]KAI6200219.1 hypothetical protein M3Y96_00709700 [Aphelenchoides besseyi]
MSTPPEEAAARLTSVDGGTDAETEMILTAAQQDSPISSVNFGREAKVSGPFGNGNSHASSPARAYLQEVRQMMRAGGKIHTPTTALNLPRQESGIRNWRNSAVRSSSASNETPFVRRVIPDARRVFAAPTFSASSAPFAVPIGEIVEPTVNTTTRPAIVNSTDSNSKTIFSKQTSVNTTSTSTILSSTTNSTASSDSSRKPNDLKLSTLPTLIEDSSESSFKMHPILPSDNIIPLDNESEQSKTDGTLRPLDELEIKSDFALQKSLQRTTVKMQMYRERVLTTSPLPKIKLLNSTFTSLMITTTKPQTSTSLRLPTLFPTLPTVTAPQFASSSSSGLFQPQQPLSVPQIITAGGSGTFSAPLQLPQSDQLISTVQKGGIITTDALEQMGCGFDILTQTCKDVFALGWCSQCTDLGANAFIHDCRCSIPTTLGRTANALFAPSTTPSTVAQRWPS